MNFVRKMEGKMRGALKRHPLVYAFVGGVGVVLFWRGVWHMNDFFSMLIFAYKDGVTSIDWAPGFDSLISLLLGIGLLLSTGLFVAELLSGQVLIATVKHEEELAEKAEKEVEEETAEIPLLEQQIHHIAEELQQIEKDISTKKKPEAH